MKNFNACELKLTIVFKRTASELKSYDVFFFAVIRNFRTGDIDLMNLILQAPNTV